MSFAEILPTRSKVYGQNENWFLYKNKEKQYLSIYQTFKQLSAQLIDQQTPS